MKLTLELQKEYLSEYRLLEIDYRSCLYEITNHVSNSVNVISLKELLDLILDIDFLRCEIKYINQDYAGEDLLSLVDITYINGYPTINSIMNMAKLVNFVPTKHIRTEYNYKLEWDCTDNDNARRFIALAELSGITFSYLSFFQVNSLNNEVAVIEERYTAFTLFNI